MKINSKLFYFFSLIYLSRHIIATRVLIQIHTLTRHGERSPCFTYPSDPYKHVWTKGLGQLTTKGLLQLKEVGAFLRHQYGEFLPETFHKKQFYIRSSDTDRTISSALAALSTLFDNEIIPVHTVPKSYDYLLKMTSVCPYHKKLLSNEFKSEKYKSFILKYSTFFQELAEGTGLQNVDIHMALRICDAVTVWSQLNLTLPVWLTENSVQKCLKLGNMKFIISYSNNLLTKFRGGPLVSNIVDSMIKRANSYLEDNTGYKMIGFFTHDSTISAFLGHLGSFNQLKPPLASVVIVELYYDSESPIINGNQLSQFSIRMLFRNDTMKSPYELNVPLCRDSANSNPSDDHEDDACRLDILYRNIQTHSLKDLPRECGLSNIIDYWFASSDKIKLGHESLVISDGESKSRISQSKHETDLYVNFLFPLLLVEIVVLIMFYRYCRR